MGGSGADRGRRCAWVTDRTVGRLTAYPWGMVAVPLVLGPVRDARTTVLACPLGEARTERAAHGGIGEGAAQGDGQPDQECGQSQPDDDQDAAAAVDPLPP